MWTSRGLRRHKSMVATETKTETKVKSKRKFSFGGRDRPRVAARASTVTPPVADSREVHVRRTMSLRSSMEYSADHDQVEYMAIDVSIVVILFAGQVMHLGAS